MSSNDATAASSAAPDTITSADTSVPSENKREEFFPELRADEDIHRVTEMESLCVQCYKNGTTRMLLTRIPFFRDVVVSSFQCEHCNWRNTEVQQCSEVAAKASRYELTVPGPENADETHKDLNRQIIKSEHATLLIKELEFEIPPKQGPGQINTLEGLVREAAEILQMGQEHRRTLDAEVTDKIQIVIDRLFKMAEGAETFTMVLDDPSGTSYLENPYAPKPDNRVTVSFYTRSRDQNIALGIPDEGEEAVPTTASITYRDKLKGFHVSHDMEVKVENLISVEERGAVIPGMCPECHMDAETRMCTTDIPHFKDIVLMVTQCEHCGYKDSEVKPGGSIGAKGRKVTLKVKGLSDFKRDILKSDTAGVTIPELELELQEGTLGGKYTTVEGLLNDMKDQLDHTYACATGDSSLPEQKTEVTQFLSRFASILDGSKPFTLIVDDPLGNSFIGSTEDGKGDDQVTVEEYERTFEQNEELGLNDIDVDEESYVAKHAAALALAEKEREAPAIQTEGSQDTVATAESAPAAADATTATS